MPTLQHLPVELHELIHQHHVDMMTEGVYPPSEDLDEEDEEDMEDNQTKGEEDDEDEDDSEDDSDSDDDSDDDLYVDVASEEQPHLWPSPDIYSQALFPYNVASTCTLWYDILIKKPKCWTKVVFDVTESSARFLDVFLWSKNLAIEAVVVYSPHFLNTASSPSSNSYDKPPDWLSVEGRDLEHSRVRDIMRVLRPHIHRCHRIAFEVAFNYCVPSPDEFLVAKRRPQIRMLSLRSYYADDLSSWAPPFDPKPVDIPAVKLLGTKTSLVPPTLTTMVMEGGWSANLVSRNPHRWSLFRMQQHSQRLRNLFIYHLKFGRAVNTIPEFVAALCNLDLESLWLGHLSRLPPDLDDDMSAQVWPSKPRSVFALRASKIVFGRGVSKRFLEELNAVARIDATDELRFLSCEIPFISYPYSAPFLTLAGVRNVSSIKNALCSWKGHNLILQDCTFDDEFLFWLQHLMIDMRFPAHNMTILAIRNCTNFTAAGLIHFIKFRSTTGLDPRFFPRSDGSFHPSKIMALEVSGRRPILTPAEEEYLAIFTKNTYLNWTNPPGDGSIIVEESHTTTSPLIAV